jgi:hypothetical protein
MMSGYLAPFANHLWQSTLFAVVVGLLALGFRRNRAAVRHRLWLAASVKFLIPFSLLVGIGSYCDEEVLRLGNDPQVYAESILKICEFYLTSPLVCVSGITGSDLKKRIEDIMRNRATLRLSLPRAVVLAVMAIVPLAGPIIFGIVNVKVVAAQPERAPSVVIPQTVQVQPPPPAATPIGAAPQAVTQGTASRGPVREYRISAISVRGVQAPQVNESIRSLLGMGVGDIYDESRLRKAFENMRRLYGSLGYVNFIPDPFFDFDEERKVVALTININEGPQFTINRISFIGNATISDDVIRREVLFKAGEVFNASLLDATLQRLNQSGNFEEIKPEDARIDPHPNEPKLDIDIRVKEKAR